LRRGAVERVRALVAVLAIDRIVADRAQLRRVHLLIHGVGGAACRTDTDDNGDNDADNGGNTERTNESTRKDGGGGAASHIARDARVRLVVSRSLAIVLQALTGRRAVNGIVDATLEGLTGVVGAREAVIARNRREDA